MTPVEGLQILCIQNKLLAFLVSVVKLLLPSALTSLKIDQDPTGASVLDNLCDEEELSIYDAVSREPYRPQR